MKSIINIIGWIGAMEVLGAYFAVSLKYIEPGTLSYQLLNLTGALLLIINTLSLKAYPSAFVNIIWVGIAIYSLFKI
jgi:hypothetical protein